MLKQNIFISFSLIFSTFLSINVTASPVTAAYKIIVEGDSEASYVIYATNSSSSNLRCDFSCKLENSKGHSSSVKCNNLALANSTNEVCKSTIGNSDIMTKVVSVQGKCN